MLRAREASRRRAIAPAHVITQSPRFSGGVESKRVRHWRLAHSVVELLAGDLEGEERFEVVQFETERLHQAQRASQLA